MPLCAPLTTGVGVLLVTLLSALLLTTWNTLLHWALIKAALGVEGLPNRAPAIAAFAAMWALQVVWAAVVVVPVARLLDLPKAARQRFMLGTCDKLLTTVCPELRGLQAPFQHAYGEDAGADSSGGGAWRTGAKAASV